MDTLASDGILGLALKQGSDITELFMNKLKDSGDIEERVFSFIMGLDQNLPSKFLVGGYDLATFAKGPIQWHNVADPSGWYVKWNGVFYGDQ